MTLPLSQFRPLVTKPVSAAAALAEPHAPVTSLYMHVPFCFHKCHYCDFYSIVDTEDRQEPFVDRLIEELTALAPHAGPLETIFVGGGTPSLLRPELWSRLLEALHRLMPLATGVEFTVECNPETVTAELMGVLTGGGVNRISMGSQSFHEKHLKTLERWHDPASVARSVGLVRAAGISRVSMDLIYAIPGQTLAEWEADLATALSFATTHLSCYNLTYEPNTAMAVRLKQGEFVPADEDLEVAMFEATDRLLTGAGLERYEVSNYAVPGQECRHNVVYWNHGQWLAAGPSASAHVGGFRYKNIGRLPDYLSPPPDAPGLPAVTDLEPPDDARAVRERIMTGLRLREGLDPVVTLAAEAARPGAGAVLAALAAEFERDGLLTRTPRWRVTARGWLLADYIARRMMQAVA